MKRDHSAREKASAHRVRRFWPIRLAGACLVLVACGGGSSGGVPGRSVVVSANQGGTVSMADGSTLQIDPGALSADTTITMERSVAQPPDGALTPVYAFGPAGTAFSTAVTVTLPLPDGTTTASVYWTRPGSATEYEAVPTTISGTTATSKVTHFSYGYIGALPGLPAASASLGAQGSCIDSRSACLEWSKNFWGPSTSIPTACVNSRASFSASPCPAANRTGRCVYSWISGQFVGKANSTSFYDATHAAVDKSDCASQSGYQGLYTTTWITG